MLNFNFHFVDFGSFDILLKALNYAILLQNFEIELLNDLLQAYYKCVVTFLDVVFHD